jgi:excisionase family DNA binding protein
MTERTATQSSSTLDHSSERFLSPVEAAKPYEPLVGVVEAAHYLNLSVAHVRKMARAGRLPVVNFGTENGRATWRFYISALADFCQSRLSSLYASTPQTGVTP